MHYNNWNEGVRGLGAELNLLKTQVRKNSLNIAQIMKSSPDPCHVITSVRTQPLSFFSRREVTSNTISARKYQMLANCNVHLKDCI